MPIPASAAAAAYINAAKDALGGVAKPPGSTAQPQESFASTLESVIDAVKDGGAKTDKITAAQTVGKADMVDVVTAVAETELTVRTLVNVRDRVVSAYQDIMRMPI